MTSPEKQLKKLRKQSTPSKSFKKELWSELDLAWDSEYPSMRFNWTRTLAIPLAAIVLFVTMGTGVYAYSSPEVTEDTPLYPVKRGIEQIEERFHQSPQARSQFHARMLERRVEEGEVLLRRGNLPKEHLVEIANELGYTIEDLAEAKNDPKLRGEIFAEVIQYIETQNVRYKHLIDSYRDHNEHGPNGELRNKFQEIRVLIDESDLNEEEKRALFPSVEVDASLNTNLLD